MRVRVRVKVRVRVRVRIGVRRCLRVSSPGRASCTSELS